MGPDRKNVFSTFLGLTFMNDLLDSNPKMPPNLKKSITKLETIFYVNANIHHTTCFFTTIIFSTTLLTEGRRIALVYSTKS